jgi:hypothetical protein
VSSSCPNRWPWRRRYGRYRLPRIREVAEAFARCSDPRFGVARLQCTNPECRAETFRPFSCQGTYLCPSCSQKRTLLFAEFLSRRLLLRLPHRVLTFTLPKILRPAFRFHPHLFAEVSRLIAGLVRQFHAHAAGQALLSGCVIAYQSWGDFCRHHPHWHGVFMEGGFDEQGRFHHVPFGDLTRMAQAFRRRVLALFLQHGLIERHRAEGLLCWKHSGFSVDGSIGLYATDPSSMERLAQYMARPPISGGTGRQGALSHRLQSLFPREPEACSLSPTSSPSSHSTSRRKTPTTSADTAFTPRAHDPVGAACPTSCASARRPRKQARRIAARPPRGSHPPAPPPPGHG